MIPAFFHFMEESEKYDKTKQTLDLDYFKNIN